MKNIHHKNVPELRSGFVYRNLRDAEDAAEEVRSSPSVSARPTTIDHFFETHSPFIYEMLNRVTNGHVKIVRALKKSGDFSEGEVIFERDGKECRAIFTTQKKKDGIHLSGKFFDADGKEFFSHSRGPFSYIAQVDSAIALMISAPFIKE